MAPMSGWANVRASAILLNSSCRSFSLWYWGSFTSHKYLFSLTRSSIKLSQALLHWICAILEMQLETCLNAATTVTTLVFIKWFLILILSATYRNIVLSHSVLFIQCIPFLYVIKLSRRNQVRWQICRQRRAWTVPPEPDKICRQICWHSPSLAKLRTSANLSVVWPGLYVSPGTKTSMPKKEWRK